jgi:nucleotide-binding universal stress UspA family protein
MTKGTDTTGAETTNVCTQVGGRIVVGVDGSACGRGALEFAVAEAERWEAPLELISAYDVPRSAGWGWELIPLEPFKYEAAATLSEALDQVDLMAPSLRAEARMEYGVAGAVLVEASRGASLLVVGSRGRSLVPGALLGSVAEYCVRYACCPVILVPW